MAPEAPKRRNPLLRFRDFCPLFRPFLGPFYFRFRPSPQVLAQSGLRRAGKSKPKEADAAASLFFFRSFAIQRQGLRQKNK